MSILTLQPIDNPEQWNQFLLSHSINTFLQSWQWGQVQKDDGETVRYLGLFVDQKQVGAALVISVKAKRGHFLLCPHGPFFITDDLFIQYLPQFIDKLKQYANEDKAVAIRIAPLVIDRPDMKAAFSALGFRPAPLHVHTELTWILDIAPPESSLLAGMRKTTRHAIKKAERAGVTVNISSDITGLDRFWPLYQTTSQRHDFVPFARDFLQSQINHFLKTQSVYFVFVKHEMKDIAAGIFIQFGSTVFYHHGASLPASSRINAPHLVQWTSIQEAKRRGATRYNFWGIAPDNMPNHPFAGITVFKKGFGGEARDYMHMQDLPVTPLYWKLWMIEQWRKYKRGF